MVNIDKSDLSVDQINFLASKFKSGISENALGAILGYVAPAQGNGNEDKIDISKVSFPSMVPKDDTDLINELAQDLCETLNDPCEYHINQAKRYVAMFKSFYN